MLLFFLIFNFWFWETDIQTSKVCSIYLKKYISKQKHLEHIVQDEDDYSRYVHEFILNVTFKIWMNHREEDLLKLSLQNESRRTCDGLCE